MYEKNNIHNYVIDSNIIFQFINFTFAGLVWIHIHTLQTQDSTKNQKVEPHLSIWLIFVVQITTERVILVGIVNFTTPPLSFLKMERHLLVRLNPLKVSVWKEKHFGKGQLESIYKMYRRCDQNGKSDDAFMMKIFLFFFPLLDLKQAVHQ